MAYPELPNYRHVIEQITLSAQLKHEHGADGIAPVLAEAEAALRRALAQLSALPESAASAAMASTGRCSSRPPLPRRSRWIIR